MPPKKRARHQLMDAEEALQEIFVDNDSHDEDFEDMEMSESDEEDTANEIGKLTTYIIIIIITIQTKIIIMKWEI